MIGYPPDGKYINYCLNCGENQDIRWDGSDGVLCCPECGLEVYVVESENSFADIGADSNA
jgi:hypothetical protein